MKVTQLSKSKLLVRVITTDGKMDQRVFNDTYIKHLADQKNITFPMIIKEIDRPAQDEFESYQEYRMSLLKALRDLEPSYLDTLNIPCFKANGPYMPLYPLGSTRSSVVFVHEQIYDKLIGLCKSSEDVQAYLKAGVTTEFHHGLFSLDSVNIEIKSDEENGQLTDGLGYISPDLILKMKAKNIIQFRAFHSNLSRSGIAKGLLKVNLDLPPNTIRFSESQLKGKINPEDWKGIRNLHIGLLRKFEGPPSTAEESWSLLEFHKHIRDSEIHLAEDKTREYIDILKDPLKLCEHQGIINRESTGLSIVDSLLKISIGSKNKSHRLPELHKHPYVMKNIQQVMATRLRHLATSGAKTCPYPVVTEVTYESGKENEIKTSLYPIGTELAIARYPLLEGRNIGYGVVSGPSDSPTEISIGKKIAEMTASDSDGDCVLVMDDPTRVKLAKELNDNKQEIIKKNHTRKCSSLFEIKDAIIENLFSAGIGGATMSMVSCELSGDIKGRREMAELVQDCTDSIKYSINTREGRLKSKHYLEQYGLPDHITNRGSKEQFSDPEKTKVFGSSPLWSAISKIYKQEMAGLKGQSLPLRAFANIFGNDAYELTKEQIRELTSIYRYWCVKVREIHKSDSGDEEKQEKFRNLVYTLTTWKNKLDGDLRHWTAAAWSITHAASGKNNIGAFVFHVFGPELIEMLIEVYDAREMIPMIPVKELDDGKTEFDVRWNHNGLNLVPDLSIACVKGNQNEYFYSNTPAEIRREDKTIKSKTAPSMESISIVALNNVSPDDLAEMLRRNQVEARPIERMLPAFDSFAYGLYQGESLLAEISDKDIPVFMKYEQKISKEIVTFNRSLKAIYVNS